MAITRTDARISVERPSQERLKELGVTSWPIWQKAPSTFAWSYDAPELCYFLGRYLVHGDKLVGQQPHPWARVG